MKRITAILGMIVTLVAAFLLLGGKKAEGPAQAGGLMNASGKPQGGAPKGPQALPVVAAGVMTREMRQILEVTGSLRTDEDVEIGSRIEGKVVAVNAKEGDRVSAGQILVRLDDRELRSQLARARAMLAAAEARLSLAHNQASFKDTTAQSDYQRAQAGLAAAKARLQQAQTNQKLIDTETRLRVETAQSGVRVARERLSIAKELTRTQELKQAQLAVDQMKARLGQAKVEVDNARQMFERRRMLFKQDAIAKEEVDEAERRFKSMQAEQRVAEADVAAAEAKLDLAKEGSRGEEIRIAEGQTVAAERALEQALSDERRKQVAQDEVNHAKASLLQAEAALKSAEAGLVQTKISQDDINSARASRDQAKADIAFYMTQLEDLVVRAPVSGVVSTRSVNVGEMVTKSSRLMTLVALETVYFEALVPELDVNLVRPGARCEVTVDALPGQQFPGAVREVIPVADRVSRSFRVRVAVLGSKSPLPANGYARARVFVGTRPGALAVTKDAVFTESGDKLVWRIAEGENGGYVARRQPVTVGLVDDRYAEIISGLEVGQRVIAAGSPAIIDGTPISIATR